MNIIKGVVSIVGAVIVGFIISDFANSNGLSPLAKNALFASFFWVCGLVWLFFKNMKNSKKPTLATWFWRIASGIAIFIGIFIAIGNISGEHTTFPYAGTIVCIAGGLTLQFLGDISFG